MQNNRSDNQRDNGYHKTDDKRTGLYFGEADQVKNNCKDQTYQRGHPQKS